MRIESNAKKQVSFDLVLNSPHDTETQVQQDGQLLMTGQLGARKERGLIGPWEGEGTKFAAKVENIGDDALSFIDKAKNDEDPFFMYLAFNAPHDPRQSPKEYVEMYPI